MSETQQTYPVSKSTINRIGFKTNRGLTLFLSKKLKQPMRKIYRGEEEADPYLMIDQRAIRIVSEMMAKLERADRMQRENNYIATKDLDKLYSPQGKHIILGFVRNRSIPFTTIKVSRKITLFMLRKQDIEEHLRRAKAIKTDDNEHPMLSPYADEYSTIIQMTKALPEFIRKSDDPEQFKKQLMAQRKRKLLALAEKIRQDKNSGRPETALLKLIDEHISEIPWDIPRGQRIRYIDGIKYTQII